ncbi:MAG: tyrosine-type recombinase/integrase [Anaplasmataceae bacterium]|nr:tyrosine-type recombinase/integrase [Anaplasmataceae bacterium]
MIHHISEFIQKWLSFLSNEKQYSKNTILSYKNDIDNLIRFLQQESLTTLDDILKADHITIRSWLSFRVKNGITLRSNLRAISALKNLYLYCQKQELFENVEIDKVKIKNKNSQIPKIIDGQDIKTIIQHFEILDDWISVRNKAIIFLLYGCGLRISEALSLSLNDIQDNQMHIKGKGNKMRYVPIIDTVKNSIKNYIDQCPYNNEKILFYTKRGKLLSRNQFANEIKKIKLNLGINSPCTPHKFRHSFASSLINSDVNIRQIQHLLGHVNLTTTQIYTQVNYDKMRAIYHNKHPRSD